VLIRKGDKGKVRTSSRADCGHPGRGGSSTLDDWRPYAREPPLINAAKQTETASADLHFGPQRYGPDGFVTLASL